MCVPSPEFTDLWHAHQLLDTDAVLSSSWRVTLGIMCGIYGLCLLASCALVPLNLYMKNNPRQSLRSRIMNTENLSVFRTPLLYAMSGVFFFTGIGGTTRTETANIRLYTLRDYNKQ